MHMTSQPMMKVNPDLDSERKKCSFNVFELTHFLDGEELFLSHPGFKDEVPIEYLSQENQYSEALKKTAILMQIIKDQKQDYYTSYTKRVGMPIETSIMRKGIGNPFFVHLVMFPPTIMMQATPEQEQFWIKQVEAQKVFATYAQTELGHGTFVRGLETTATYLPETQEFELNSPNLTSYKWWPGITLGDIGHKFGFNAVNNGFMAFNKVRIPRNYMLMKNAQVLPDGSYVKSKGSSKLIYGSMMFVRVGVVVDMSFHVAKALTIAIRYSAVRRQSEMKPGEREPQILDYRTQQYKLLPYLSYHTSMNINDVTALEDWQSRLLAQLRPNAVGLVDAFDFRDEVLDSTLGAWDGQVYQRLFDSAMKSPLNAKPKGKNVLLIQLNSPIFWMVELKSTKNEMGHTANYAVVAAQLYTKGQCHGIHFFIVQIRDEKTYQPLPGIKVGDIGQKFGMNAVNNGFIAFNKVRIPRNQMLMKNSQVLQDGTYVKSSANSKLAYGSMIYVRVMVAYDMGFNISRAVTIAVRDVEAQILDFQTQQYKLLPWLASIYAIRFSLHAMACCMKAMCSKDAAQAVETVRLACGGHGYMTCSNLPTIYADVAAANTYEGENTVLLLQTARALVKAWGKVNAGQPVSSIMAYLASKKVITNMTSGLAPELAWNSASVQLVQAAETHCRAFLVERYVDALRTHMNELNPELRAVMQQLCELYCDWQSRLLTQLRLNAVGLVDAFDFKDEVLGSALGAWDGQAYQRLLDNAMKSPLNANPVHDSFYASIAPMLKAKY
ncbi:hypothetical protein B566_EDAN008190 [Ephemera danica]|nr:hypothetical protein B566_EDAN008190 [Ephemera danica]